MSWRTLLGLVLLVAAAVTGWSAWNMRERAAPDAGAGQRSDYVLRDFELVTLGKDGTESVRLRAPELQRSREDESLDIVRPLFLMPGEGGGWQLAADRGWVRRHEAATLAQIEKAARRLAAIRGNGGSITRAAAQLGMSHAALSEWVARRTLPE